MSNYNSEAGLFQVGLFELALHLHMAHTGSADPMTEKDEKVVIDYLLKRLREWKPTHGSWASFDNAARCVVEAALEERGIVFPSRQ